MKNLSLKYLSALSSVLSRDEQQEILSWTENWQRGNVIVHMNECSRKFSNKQDEFRAGGQNEDEDMLMDVHRAGAHALTNG